MIDYIRGNNMKLKVGDKVKMTPEGFRFYSNLNTAYHSAAAKGNLSSEAFVKAVCELFAVRGTGVIIKFSTIGEPYIKWTFRDNGTFFHRSHFYEVSHVRKLTVLERFSERNL
jgi:hypothetical protein